MDDLLRHPLAVFAISVVCEFMCRTADWGRRSGHGTRAIARSTR